MTVLEIDQAVGQALSEVLRDGVDIHRGLAAQALAKVNGLGAVDALISALLDEDEDVRGDAAAGLARLADPRSGEQLLANLVGDPVREVKLHAIDALVAMGHADVEPWLRRIVLGRDVGIVWSDPSAENGWDDWVDIQISAINGLAKLGCAQSVPDIVRAIEDELNQDLTGSGFMALAELGPTGIQALSKYLSHPNARWRRRAAALLIVADFGDGGKTVAHILRDPNAEVRLAGGRALAAREPGNAHLKTLFSDNSSEVRAEAVRMCGRHHPQQLGVLLVEENNSDVQVAILTVLAAEPHLLSGQNGNLVRPFLRSPDASVVARAAEALGAVEKTEAIDDLKLVLENGRFPVEARLGALTALVIIGGDHILELLIAAANDQDRQLFQTAVTALAEFSVKVEWPNTAGETLLAMLVGSAVPQAVSSLNDPGEEISAPEKETLATDKFPTSTLDAIVRQPHKAATKENDQDKIALTQKDLDFLALADRSPRKKRVALNHGGILEIERRRFVVRILGNIAQADVACALAEQLSDDDTEVAHGAASSLAELAGKMAALPEFAIAELVRQVSRSERDVRYMAVRALGRTGAEGLRPALNAAQNDPDCLVRAEAVRAVAHLPGLSAGTERHLDDPDISVRLAAAEVLASAANENTVDMLVNFAFSHDGQHRRDVTGLLADIDPAAACQKFLTILNDGKRRREWPVAIEALGELY